MAKTSWVTRENARIFANLESQARDYGFFLHSLSKINPALLTEAHLDLLVQARSSFSAIKQAIEQHDYLGADFFTPIVFSQVIASGSHAQALIRSLKKISSQKDRRQERTSSFAPGFDLPSLTHAHWGCLLSSKSQAVPMSDLLIILEKTHIFSEEISTLLKLQRDEVFPLWKGTIELYTHSREKISRENFINLIDAGVHAPQLAEALKIMPSTLLCDKKNRQSLLAAGPHAPIFAFCLTNLLPNLLLEQSLDKKKSELLQEISPLLIQSGAYAVAFLIGVAELIQCDLLPQNREYFVHLLNAQQESADLGRLIAQIHKINPSFLINYKSQILAHPQKSQLFSELSQHDYQNEEMGSEKKLYALLHKHQEYPLISNPSQPLIFHQQPHLQNSDKTGKNELSHMNIPY